MAIQIRRGTEAAWKEGKQGIVVGEPAITIDTGRLFVGTDPNTYGDYAEFLNASPTINIKFANKGLGLYGIDKTDTEYPLIHDNSVNLWIGARDSVSPAHTGSTLISSGYNDTTGKGNDSILVAVPNAANTSASAYKVLINRVRTYSYSAFGYTSISTYYTTGETNAPTAVKCGRLVTLAGAFKNTSSIAASVSTSTKIGTVPAGCEPQVTFRTRQQGSGVNSFFLEIQTDGSIYVGRYGASEVIAFPANTWLNISATYMSKTLEDGN